MYASRPQEFADGTFTDEHWGDGPGKTTSLMAWFVKKVPMRSAGAIVAHIRKLLAENGAIHGAPETPVLSIRDKRRVNGVVGFCVIEPDYNALVAETEDVLDVDATPCDEEGVGEDGELVNALGSHGRVHHE